MVNVSILLLISTLFVRPKNYQVSYFFLRMSSNKNRKSNLNQLKVYDKPGETGIILIFCLIPIGSRKRIELLAVCYSILTISS